MWNYLNAKYYVVLVIRKYIEICLYLRENTELGICIDMEDVNVNYAVGQMQTGQEKVIIREN
jgi:hypothetical protein